MFILPKKYANVFLSIQEFNGDCYESDEGFIVKDNGTTYIDTNFISLDYIIDPF